VGKAAEPRESRIKARRVKGKAVCSPLPGFLFAQFVSLVFDFLPGVFHTEFR